jgi:acetyl esterase/lipase
LQQAVSLVNYLVVSERISPASITLLGDSAGAHLLLSLLLHLNHPKPGIAELKIGTAFASAVLVSPWVKLEPTASTTKARKEDDILTAPSLAYWAKNFLGGAALDPWNSPLMAPADWWDNLPAKKILVTYGEKELLREDAEALCEILQKHHAETTTMKFSNELHVHMVMNRFLLINKPCESQKAYMQWLDNHVSS